MQLVTKKISDMYVECSLQTHNFREPGVAMSDCCRRRATAAVVMPNGSKMWRCSEHKNVVGLHPFSTGESVTEIEMLVGLDKTVPMV